MLDNKFLNKVYNQIMSETKIINDKIHAPFFFSSSFSSLFSLSFSLILSPSLFASFLSHCKNVYCLNKEESEYVWEKYKKELTDIINEKELC